MTIPIIPYNYLDPRAFLTDVFKALKDKDRSFSYRAFARLAGSSSPNFLQHVQTFRLRLKETHVKALAKALEMSTEEKKYLLDLVRFDSTRDQKGRERLARTLLNRQSKSQSSRTLRRDEFEYYRHWYHTAVRALVGCGGFAATPEACATIAARLSPTITPAQAASSIKLLLRLNLIRVGAAGIYEETDQVVSSGDDLRSIEVVGFQKETLRLAAKALETVAADQRDISTVTFTVSEAGFLALQQKLRVMRKELIEIARLDSNEDRVYHLNLQLFPMTTQRSASAGGKV